MKSTRNEVVAQLSDATGSDAATCSMFIRAFYDLRARLLMESPAAVHQFDAEELLRAEEREEAKAPRAG